MPVTRQPAFSGVSAACGPGQAHVRGGQLRQPGGVREPHRGLDAGGGYEILVAGYQMGVLGGLPEIHLPGALSAWGIEALSTITSPRSEGILVGKFPKFAQNYRWIQAEGITGGVHLVIDC